MSRESSFVLVHGAWQTAATWDLVEPRLRASGRRVVNALLTGLERDAPALSGNVTLDTHIHDVVGLLEREALHDVVLLPDAIANAFRAQADADGGWRLRSSDRQLDLWGLEEGPARDFVGARLSDFTIRCFEQPIQLPARAATKLTRSYIACVREGYPARVVFEPFATRARQEGWRYHELPTGHDCHVEMPDAVTELLLEADRLTKM